MARGRGRRVIHVNANDTLPDLQDLGLEPQDDALIEDRRVEHPEVSPLPRSRSGRPAPIAPAVVSKTRSGARARAPGQFNQLAFTLPRDVLVCVRRQTRKEVLLAKGKGGRNRPPKRGPWSHIHCRRK